MGCPQIGKSNLRGRRVDSRCAGTTPSILPIEVLRVSRLAAAWNRAYPPRIYFASSAIPEPSGRTILPEVPRILPVGKLPPRLLEALLASCPAPRASRVVLGPRYGEDAAVIEMGRSYLVAKTDPITLTTNRLGWYAVNINANDVAV